MINLF
jgi:hypothetical protein